MKTFTAKNFKLGDVIASGMCAELTAGEAITALNVCYIKASDSLAYKLGTGISEANTAIAVVALETIASGFLGRFMLKGSVEYSSWAFTPGNKVELSSTPGDYSETVS